MTQLPFPVLRKVFPGIVLNAALLALLLMPLDASANAGSPAPAPVPTTEECFNDSQGLGLICVPAPKNGGNRQAEPVAPQETVGPSLELWLGRIVEWMY